MMIILFALLLASLFALLGALTPKGLYRWTCDHPYLTVACMAVLSRLAIYAVGIAAHPELWGDMAALGELFAGADSPHYIRIAQFGYEPHDPEYAKLIVFYPLFPLLLKVMNLIIPEPHWAGMAVSVLALAGSCVMIYQWCRELHLSHGTGLLAVLMLLIYPFSVFTGSCYTESLFILLIAASTLCLYRRQWLLGSVLGLLASLCRTQGVVLLFWGIYCLIAQREGCTPVNWARRVGCTLLIPLGYVIYLGLNAVLYGDPMIYLAFEHDAPWYQGTAWFFDNLAQHYQMTLDHPGLTLVLYGPQIIAFFLALALTVYGARQVHPGLAAYGALLLIMSYTASWLLSGPRYILGIFPLFIFMAHLMQRHRKAGFAMVLVSSGLCILYTILFLEGQAIM